MTALTALASRVKDDPACDGFLNNMLDERLTYGSASRATIQLFIGRVLTLAGPQETPELVKLLNRKLDERDAR